MRSNTKNTLFALMLAVLSLLAAHTPAQAQGGFTFLALQQASPNPVGVGKTILLTGSAFPVHPIVYLLPTDNPFVGPQIAKLNSASNNQVSVQLPAQMCEGKYDIYIKDVESNYQTNTLPIVVLPSKPALYDVTLSKITCLKESHDVSDTDEVYFFGLTYNLTTNVITTSGSELFVEVDGGETLDVDADGKISLLPQPVADPTQPLLECALAECDNYHFNFYKGYRTWDDSFGVTQDAYAAWKADNARNDILSKYAQQFLSPNYPRGYKSALMQTSMQNSIEQLTGDDPLGVFELKFTAADVDTARKYFGKPYLKVVDVYGDSSHYRLQFHLTRVQ